MQTLGDSRCTKDKADVFMEKTGVRRHLFSVLLDLGAVPPSGDPATDEVRTAGVKTMMVLD